MGESSCQKILFDTLSKKHESIKKVSDEIWKNPETSWNEKHAHQILTTFLSSEGFEVEKNFVRETGFRATYEVVKDKTGDSGDQQTTPVNVCFLCQYDALPEIGHGAGHNLVSAVSIASAVAVRYMLEEKQVGGKVTVLGTPGEDCGGGGKIDMIAHQAFKDVDLCLMTLPMNVSLLYPQHFRLLMVNVKYKGKAAHASAFPWEGRNALDAAVACYTNIALLRQQLKPTWMINGIISDGGTQANLIPAHAELKFWIRAPTAEDICLIQSKCSACFIAAAKATNTVAEFEFDDNPYEVMEHSVILGSMFEQKAKAVGLKFAEKNNLHETHLGAGDEPVYSRGSTDMGNVSTVVPSICPTFNIGTTAILHSPSFHDACGTPEAFEHAMKVARALALTASEFVCSRDKLKSVTEAHEELRRHSSSHEVLKRAQDFVEEFVEG